jgi:histidyl-tRNA synthetase
MEELNLIPAVSSAAEVFLPFFDRDRLNDYLKLAADLRRVGFRVEFYPEPKKVGQQLKYAGQRGFQVAVIAGEDEFNKGTCQIKNLEARTSEEVDMSKGLDHVATAIRSILEG